MYIKSKVVLDHVRKAYRGTGSITPPTLNLGIRWRRVVSPHALAALYPMKQTTVLIE